MSFENAKENLKELGKELNLPELSFDENNTCILGIDNAFSLHITFETHSDRLYLYSPILDGFPKEDKMKLTLFEAILEASLLGGQMLGGGAGVAIKEELILMHCTIEMGPSTEATVLSRVASYFVDLVEKWRKRVQNILAGTDPGATGIPGGGPLPGGGGPGGPRDVGGIKPSGGQQNGLTKPGDHFIKI